MLWTSNILEIWVGIRFGRMSYIVQPPAYIWETLNNGSGITLNNRHYERKHRNYARIVWHVFIYPCFADVDMGIYPHAASQYHARPKANRGIAILSVDKFLYPRKHTRGNEFIPCLSHSKTLTPHSPIAAARKVDRGRDRQCDVINDVPSLFLSHADDVKREIRVYISRLWANHRQEPAPSMG